MKVILLVTGFLTFGFTSCKKKTGDPLNCALVCSFTYSADTLLHKIKFTNTSSSEAVVFNWNFGDNTSSTEKNPLHAYANPGTFTVKVAAAKSDGSCITEQTAQVIVPLNTISAPQAYTTRVLLEQFTGCWCGYCVDGALKLEELVDVHNGKVIATSIHQGDPMEEPGLFTTLNSTFQNISPFPTGMVNRVIYNSATCMSHNYWDDAINQQLIKVVQCGVACNTMSTNDSAKIEVHASFNQNLTGTYNLSIFLVEDYVMGDATYDQQNYYSSAYLPSPAGPPTHYYYNFPVVIPNFSHMQVVRKSLTSSVLGETIPASYIHPNGRYITVKNILIPSTYNKANLKVVALVCKTGISYDDHEVINVVQVKLNSGKGWD